MSNLNPTPGWDDVPQLETTTQAIGGTGGPMNLQAQALLNRTEALNPDNQAAPGSLNGTETWAFKKSGAWALAGLAAIAAYVVQVFAGFIQNAVGAVSTTIQGQLREVIRPSQFGAIGNGTADDGAALNLALDHLRTLITGTPNLGKVVRLDLSGKTYVTTLSLNATGLLEGWEIVNGTIIGKCTGKAVLDMIGSRFGTVRNVTILGDKTNRPSVGLQAARSSFQPGTYGFCDGMLFDKVHTTGYFSVAAAHFYGQEGTTYSRCTFWNSDKDAYVAIHTGYNSVTMSSDYLAPVTGSQSYINNKYIGVDYMFYADDKVASITGISKANPAVVTAPGHPFVNGDTVVIGYVGGMTEINNTVAVVASATTNTFQLTGVNSTAYSTFTSGGIAIIAQTKPTVLFARGEQHHWDTCYCVNYGTDSIAIDFPDAQQLKSVDLDILFEGAGSRSHVRFLAAGEIKDFSLRTYNTHCRDYIISTAAAGVVTLHAPTIKVANFSVGAPVLVSDVTKFAFYGADVLVPSSAALSVTSLQDRFTGTIRYTADGSATNLNMKYADYRDGTYAVTATPGGGAFGSVTATGYSRRVGDLTYVEIDVLITTTGTATGAVSVNLPYNVGARAAIGGREYAVAGWTVMGLSNASGNQLVVSKYDGASPITANGVHFTISGWYRAA